MNLNEKVNEYLNDPKYGRLTESQEALMKTLLENTGLSTIPGKMAGITEATTSGDVAQFTPILMPIVRRVFPALVANQLLGIQPMTMPTGYIYALVNRYTGTSEADKKIEPVNKGQILVLDGAIDPSTAVGTAITGGTSGATGTIIHCEKDGLTILVKLDDADNKFSVENIGIADVKAVYSNESTFHRILKDYTGAYTTAEGEKLSTDMATIGFGVEKVTIEAQTRKLKAEYTLEMYDDLQAQHALLVDEELTNLISAEIQSEIDREVIQFVNDNATIVPDAVSPRNTFLDNGRWEIENYRANALKIDLEARNIGLMTKRGSGNVLVVSPKVATMLEAIGTFNVAPVGATNIQNDIFTGLVGTYNGRYSVIVDQYASDDYVTIVYKGTSSQDAMGFFCPYVPLTFQKVVNYDSAQPAIVARTRYALAANPVEPENYARTFAVDLTNTILA